MLSKDLLNKFSNGLSPLHATLLQSIWDVEDFCSEAWTLSTSYSLSYLVSNWRQRNSRTYTCECKVPTSYLWPRLTEDGKEQQDLNQAGEGIGKTVDVQFYMYFSIIAQIYISDCSSFRTSYLPFNDTVLLFCIISEYLIHYSAYSEASIHWMIW